MVTISTAVALVDLSLFVPSCPLTCVRSQDQRSIVFPNVYTEGIAEPKKFELGTVRSSDMLSNRCKIVGLNSQTFYLIALIGSNLYF